MRTLPTGFKQVSDLNEIIFAHRNKLYGAYELRKHYNDRLLKAFLLALSSLGLLLLISFAMNNKPPVVIADFFPADTGTLQTFTYEEVKVKKAVPKDPLKTDQPPTLIVNDTASEQKHDSVKVETSGNNSSLHGDTTSNGGNTGKPGIASDSLTSEKTADETFKSWVPLMPSFPGGDKAFARYIQRHFSCDGSSIPGRNNDGKLVLRFVIMKDGSLTRVEVLRNDVGIDCANEAKSVLLKSPKWNPGIQNNQPVNVQMLLPITIVRQ